MLIDLRDAPLTERGLMNALVAPRPVAWISSRDGEGRGNLSPFSHFTVASSAPPVIVVSLNTPEDRPLKDTLLNAVETGVVAVNLVGAAQASVMVASSAALPRGEDEAAAQGIAMEPCETIDCPRVAESPATLECRLYKTMEIPPEMPGDSLSTLLFGRVVGIRLREEYLDARGRFDGLRAGLVARGGGNQYLAMEQVFEIAAPFRRVGNKA